MLKLKINKMRNFKALSIVLLFIISSCAVKAQKSDTSYVKSIYQRAAKIVDKLAISQKKKAEKVTQLVANQYIDLNDVYIARDKKNKAIKEQDINKEIKETQLNEVAVWTDAEINKLHVKYLRNLNKHLNDEQVITIKDGMTYGVVPLTFKAYQEMLPNLTQEQKNQIYIWLVEAREHAMDAESSEKKHAWFGKYKGKVNNYLSAEGIDMKKAGEEWQERIRKEKAQKAK